MTVGDRVLATPTDDSHAGLQQMLAEFRSHFSAATDPASMAGLFATDGAVVSLQEGWTREGSDELEALWTSGFANHRPFPRDVVYTDTRFLSENIAVVEGSLERGSAEVDGRTVPAQREFFTLIAAESRGRWRIVEARAGGWTVVNPAGS